MSTFWLSLAVAIAALASSAVCQVVTPTLPPRTLVNQWSFDLPNTTLPTGGLAWAAYSTYLSTYASTTVDGTLFVVNASIPSFMFSFNEWKDGVDTETAAQRSIVITTHSVLVLRGSILHAIDTRNGLERYAVDLGSSVSSIQFVSDEWLLAIHDRNTTEPHIAMINPTTGARLWRASVTLSFMVTVSSTNVAAVQLHGDGTKFDLVVLNAADGSDILRTTYATESDSMIYIMGVEMSSVEYLIQVGPLQKVVRSVFGVTNLLPFNFTVDPDIWGYGIGPTNDGGVLWFQAGDDSIKVYSYNYTDGVMLATSATVGVAPGAAHIVGEPEFALLAYTGVNDSTLVNLTGWNVDGTNRFVFELQNISSAHVSATPKSMRSKKFMSGIAYSVMANFDGQLVLPDRDGLYFVDGNVPALDDSLAGQLPGLVRENIALDSNSLLLTYGSTVAGFAWQ